jgi:hypothetical protein
MTVAVLDRPRSPLAGRKRCGADKCRRLAPRDRPFCDDHAKSPLIGSTTPRIFTKPLVTGESGPCGCGCALTPETSRGFDAVEFAAELGIKLMPWQRWVLIHALETLPDGSYRFRKVLLLVSRQNGKTTILKVLSLWRMLRGTAKLVLGTSTMIETARESFELTVEMLEDSSLADRIFKIGRASTSTYLKIDNGTRYVIRAANRKGARTYSVDLGICDEVREHSTWAAIGAIDGALTATPDPQLWMMSNAGDSTSIVLDHFRSQAMTAIELAVTEATDTANGLALFEYSGEDDCDLDDRVQWTYANPALGYTITERTLIEKLGLPPAVFRTEHLCQSVPVDDPAIASAAWEACKDVTGTLANLRSRVALCIDVAPDDAHASLAAAALTEDGRIRLEIVAAWDTAREAAAGLSEHIVRVSPAVIGWFPSGPAAELKADMEALEAEKITGDDVFAACQGMAGLATGRKLLHPGDPLLDTHVANASKFHTGDRWRFARKGGVGHVDAAYAAAGAIHLARTLPPPEPKPAKMWVV